MTQPLKTKGKRKSLVGWLVPHWKYMFKFVKSPDKTCQEATIPLFTRKVLLPGHEVKVRITIEEI